MTTPAAPRWPSLSVERAAPGASDGDDVDDDAWVSFAEDAAVRARDDAETAVRDAEFERRSASARARRRGRRRRGAHFSKTTRERSARERTRMGRLGAGDAFDAGDFNVKICRVETSSGQYVGTILDLSYRATNDARTASAAPLSRYDSTQRTRRCAR